MPLPPSLKRMLCLVPRGRKMCPLPSSELDTLQRGAGPLESHDPSPPHQPVPHTPISLQSVMLKKTPAASTLGIAMGATSKQLVD
jgi:hypothetical protein